MPKTPDDFTRRRAINLRLPTPGSANAWRLTKDGRDTGTQVNGLLTSIGIHSSLDVAPDGRGLAYVPLGQARHHLDHGAPAHVPREFAPDPPGYHLCYPSRRHASTAFGLLADTRRRRT
jgi:DNA-binding transcriptional LysR family regulator